MSPGERAAGLSRGTQAAPRGRRVTLDARGVPGGLGVLRETLADSPFGVTVP